jgi:multidrug efflux pump subunit AcrA (membrane-fusion protein)
MPLQARQFSVLAAGALLFSAAMAQSPQWFKVRKDTLRVELTESGEVGAVRSTVIAAPHIWQLDLRIIDLALEGTTVDSGAVVARFDPSALLTQLNTRKTELDMNLATLQSVHAEHTAQMRELEREVEIAEYTLKLAEVQFEQLKFESAVRQENGQLEVLKAEISVKEAKTRLEAQKIINHSAEKKLQLTILQAQGAVNDLQRQMDQLVLRAPLSGMVVYHSDWDGSKPQLGGKIRPGRGVIDLPDLSRMQVKIPVHEVDAAKLKTEQEALITLEAFPSKTFRGRLLSVTRIASKKEPESQVRVFEAILEIVEKDSLLKPGMTAQVRLQLELVPDAILVPAGCVFEQEGRAVVFTKKSPQKPVPVQFRGRNDFYVSVSGIETGTEVSWQAGTPSARPLGYAAFTQRTKPPASEREQFFSEMSRRHLTFDYEAFRNSPPQPPGGAPGGMEAMFKQLGVPGGEMASQGRITLTPESIRQMAKPGSAPPAIKADSTASKNELKVNDQMRNH